MNRGHQIWAIGLLVLLLLAAGLTGGPHNPADRWLIDEAARLRAETSGLAAIAGMLTELGGAKVTLGSAMLGALYLLIRRAGRSALLLMITVIGVRLLVEAMKALTDRPRPETEWIAPTSMAFPSGHSANSMTSFLLLAILVSPPAYRRLAAGFALSVAVMIGMTRTLLGVHWPSDVIGGWALGLAAVLLADRLGRPSVGLPDEQQHQIVGGHRAPLSKDKAS